MVEETATNAQNNCNSVASHGTVVLELNIKQMEATTYIPALKYRSLTRFYDWLISAFLREKTWKGFLIKSVAYKKPSSILDIGTGTATLAMMIAQSFPSAQVHGLDGDHEILEIAARKINASGLNVKLQRGFSYELPYPDNSFDVVMSSLMLHHLSNEDKHRTLREVFRVLKPSGVFAIADWGKPSNIFVRILFLLVQMLDGFKTTRDNVRGLLPAYVSKNGFVNVKELKRFNTVLGSISIYHGEKI